MVIEISRREQVLDARALAPLVQSLGQDRFGNALLATVHAGVGAELLSAFSLDDAGQPRFRFACAVDELGNAFALRAAQRYVGGYWHDDPGLDQLVRTQQHCGSSVLCQQGWNQIRDPRYRALCYEQPQLVDRMSLLTLSGRDRLLFSAYRRALRGPFAQDEVQRFAAHAETLAALVDKHVQLVDERMRVPPRGATGAIEERLAAAFPALSARERQVCAGLVAGMAAKEIAHACDIEPSSVVTYKKRAFEKLGVANRRALLNLWNTALGRCH